MVFNPTVKNTLAKIKTGITSDLTKLEPPADYVALRKLVSTQLPIDEVQGNSSDCSTAFIGDFSNMAIALRQNITIEASRQSSDVFTKNQVHVRAIMRADIAILRGDHFGRLIGIRA